MLCTATLSFTSEKFTVSESMGYVEIGVMLSGRTFDFPITVIITPSEQSPISAMGKYIRMYIHIMLYVLVLHLYNSSIYVCTIF